MRKLFLCWLIVLCSRLHVNAAPIAEEVQHLRSVIRNIQWPMFYVTDALHAGTSCNEFEFIGVNGAYTALGTSDRYFSSIEVPAGQTWDVGGGNCNIHLTLKSIIKDSEEEYDLPVPDMITGAKIVLSLLDAPIGLSPTWSCKTNIDIGLNKVFQGASTMLIENAPSIIAHFTDNIYLGNCLYTPMPW